MDGRVIDAFQRDFSSNQIIKRDVSIEESGQIKFKIVDDKGVPQKSVIVENWVYSSVSNSEGFTEWINILPNFIDREPYAAKATFQDGTVAWSESFVINEDEQKIIEIVRKGKE